MATIVVVEDQPDNLKLITALLTVKGHRVVGLTAGEPLAATLLAEQPPPRLVLLDIQLPGRDGYSVLAEVKRIEGAPPWRSSPSLPTPCRVTGRKRWPPGSTTTSPSRSTSARFRTKWLDYFLHPDRAVHGLEVDVAAASTERPLHIPTHELAVHRERIVGGDRAVHRLRIYFRVELRW